MHMPMPGIKGSGKTNGKQAMLMLIVSELGEAMEALRHGDFLNFDEELADVMIRMGDMCGGLGIDLEYAIEKKMAVNAKRPHKHGKQF